jgi:hypothetical protein
MKSLYVFRTSTRPFPLVFAGILVVRLGMSSPRGGLGGRSQGADEHVRERIA